jgi:hypothetical protein
MIWKVREIWLMAGTRCVLLESQGHMDAESKGRVWIDDDDSDDDDSDDDDSDDDDELQRYTMQNVNIRNRSNP